MTPAPADPPNAISVTRWSADNEKWGGDLSANPRTMQPWIVCQKQVIRHEGTVQGPPHDVSHLAPSRELVARCASAAAPAHAPAAQPRPAEGRQFRHGFE
jgi:hypothetical protein